MLIADTLFIIGWWPKESLNQTDFKWIQLFPIIVLNAMLFKEMKITETKKNNNASKRTESTRSA